MRIPTTAVLEQAFAGTDSGDLYYYVLETFSIRVMHFINSIFMRPANASRLPSSLAQVALFSVGVCFDVNITRDLSPAKQERRHGGDACYHGMFVYFDTSLPRCILNFLMLFS